jgi:hypothetical protein
LNLVCCHFLSLLFRNIYLYCVCLQIDELETELFTLKIEHDHVVLENEQNKRTAVDVTDTNHLLTLKLKAANYEIEHMSAELHLDRHKMEELRRDLDTKQEELSQRVKELSWCDDNCNEQRNTIDERDLTIENLENEILDLKGLPRKAKNQIPGGGKEITADDDYGDQETEREQEQEQETAGTGTEAGTKQDSGTCFLTDLEVEVEEVKPPPPSPERVSFLPGVCVCVCASRVVLPDRCMRMDS